jgi:hypothetical protein
MASLQYENGSLQTLLDSGLNSLGDGSAALSSAYDNSNSSNLYMWGIFELYIAGFGSAPTAGELVEMYFSDSVDGTNYSDGSTTGPVKSDAHFIAGFPVRNSSSAQRITIPNPISIPSCAFKVLLINETGQTFAASSNTLKMLPVRMASA